MSHKEEQLDRSAVVQEFNNLSKRLENDFPGETFYIFIVGGVPLMEYTGYKKSSDIDVFAYSDSRLLDYFPDYFMNTRSAGMSSSFSADMEDRVIDTEFSTDNLKVYAASLEDIVASKLIANRDKDIEDISLPGVVEKINYEKLEKIIHEELSIDLTPLNYNMLLITYDRWIEHLKQNNKI